MTAELQGPRPRDSFVTWSDNRDVSQSSDWRIFSEVAHNVAAQSTGTWSGMTQRKRPAASSRKLSRSDKVASGKVAADEVASAFDIWLERGLHKIFDDVANEPIPPELLQLIEGDRRRTDGEEQK